MIHQIHQSCKFSLAFSLAPSYWLYLNLCKFWPIFSSQAKFSSKKIKIYLIVLHMTLHIYVPIHLTHIYNISTCNMCDYGLGFLHFIESMEDLMKATHLRACMLAASKPFVVFFSIPRGFCLFFCISSQNIFFRHF